VSESTGIALSTARRRIASSNPLSSSSSAGIAPAELPGSQRPRAPQTRPPHTEWAKRRPGKQVSCCATSRELGATRPLPECRVRTQRLHASLSAFPGPAGVLTKRHGQSVTDGALPLRSARSPYRGHAKALARHRASQPGEQSHCLAAQGEAVFCERAASPFVVSCGVSVEQDARVRSASGPLVDPRRSHPHGSAWQVSPPQMRRAVSRLLSADTAASMLGSGPQQTALRRLGARLPSVRSRPPQHALRAWSGRDGAGPESHTGLAGNSRVGGSERLQWEVSCECCRRGRGYAASCCAAGVRQAAANFAPLRPPHSYPHSHAALTSARLYRRPLPAARIHW